MTPPEPPPVASALPPFRRRAALVAGFLLLPWFLAIAVAAAPVIAPRFQPVRDGLDHAELRLPEGPWILHIVRLHRARTNLEIAGSLACGAVQGVATVSRQAEAARAAGRFPVAAVNGGYFNMESGAFLGAPGDLLIVNGELIHPPANTSFWGDAAGRLHIAVIFSQMEITWPDGGKTPLGLNEPPADKPAVLFTPTFGKSVPLHQGAALVLAAADAGPWLPLRAGHDYAARLESALPPGDISLPRDRLILAVSEELRPRLARLKPGDILHLSTALTADLSQARTGLGGGPTLLSGGVPNQAVAKPNPGEPEVPRHPRTAIGFNEHYFFIVVVDGRQRSSVGMTYLEVLAVMQQLGCTDAMNLDGGGSTTLWLDGRVVNSPSGRRERPTADALLVLATEP